jgi:hypothetical protein
MVINPNPALWQMAAIELCRFACNGDSGRGKDDPVYRDVTEGRDGPGPLQRREYSSCGDLPHWMLERLGIREKWVNRESLNQYHVGMNIVELGYGCPISHAAPTAADWAGPGPGDICEIWNGAQGQDAHVFVCLGPSDKVDGKLLTANYGAGGMSEALWPGARLSNSSFTHTEVGWYIGTRKLQRIIRLADYVPLITAQPDLTGAAIDGQAITDLGAAWAEDVS